MPIKFYTFILITLIFFNCGSFKQNTIELQEEKLNHILDSYVESGVYPFLYARIEGESGTVYEHAVTDKDLLGNLKVDGDTWIRIWSMSKLVTISVAMDLIEENKLSLSDPVIKYIPEFKDLKVAVDKRATKKTKNKFFISLYFRLKIKSCLNKLQNRLFMTKKQYLISFFLAFADFFK